MSEVIQIIQSEERFAYINGSKSQCKVGETVL